MGWMPSSRVVRWHDAVPKEGWTPSEGRHGPPSKTVSLPFGQAASSAHHLVGMLARKGYSSGLAFAVVRDELAAAGREEPQEPHSI